MPARPLGARSARSQKNLNPLQQYLASMHPEYMLHLYSLAFKGCEVESPFKDIKNIKEIAQGDKKEPLLQDVVAIFDFVINKSELFKELRKDKNFKTNCDKFINYIRDKWEADPDKFLLAKSLCNFFLEVHNFFPDDVELLTEKFPIKTEEFLCLRGSSERLDEIRNFSQVVQRIYGCSENVVSYFAGGTKVPSWEEIHLHAKLKDNALLMHNENNKNSLIVIRPEIFINFAKKFREKLIEEFSSVAIKEELSAFLSSLTSELQEQNIVPKIESGTVTWESDTKKYPVVLSAVEEFKGFLEKKYGLLGYEKIVTIKGQDEDENENEDLDQHLSKRKKEDYEHDLQYEQEQEEQRENPSKRAVQEEEIYTFSIDLNEIAKIVENALLNDLKTLEEELAKGGSKPEKQDQRRSLAPRNISFFYSKRSTDFLENLLQSSDIEKLLEASTIIHALSKKGYGSCHFGAFNPKIIEATQKLREKLKDEEFLSKPEELRRRISQTVDIYLDRAKNAQEHFIKELDKGSVMGKDKIRALEEKNSELYEILSSGEEERIKKYVKEKEMPLGINLFLFSNLPTESAISFIEGTEGDLAFLSIFNDPANSRFLQDLFLFERKELIVSLVNRPDFDQLFNALYERTLKIEDNIIRNRVATILFEMICLSNEQSFVFEALGGKVNDLIQNFTIDLDYLQQERALESYFAVKNKISPDDDVVNFIIKNKEEEKISVGFFNRLLFAALKNNQDDVVKKFTQALEDVRVVRNRGGSTALIEACLMKKVDIARLFLDKKFDVNAQNSLGFTALMAAAEKGCIEIVQMLLERGADVNLRDGDRAGPLDFAAQNGHTEVVKMLLANGAEPSFGNEEGPFSLVIAAQKGYAKIVKMLLDKKIDVNAKGRNGSLPLFLAAEGGHIEIMQMLLANGADVNLKDGEGAFPLIAAAQNGHTEAVTMLLANGAEVDLIHRNGFSSLIVASLNGHTEIVKMLLANGADINFADKNGFTPLFCAAQNGHTEAVKMLLENGAEVNLTGKHSVAPLLAAIQNGHTDIAEIFFNRDEDVNFYSANNYYVETLALASQNGHVDIVKMLLKKGIGVNSRCGSGVTSLFLAVQNGHSDVTRLLLDRGANFDEEVVVLMRAASGNGHVEVLKILFEKITDPIFREMCRKLALLDASKNGHVDIVKYLFCGVENDSAEIASYALPHAVTNNRIDVVKFLLEKGANLESINGALIFASKQGNLDFVRLLLDKGADIKYRGPSGNTALTMAVRENHIDLVKFLVNWDADLAKESVSNALIDAARFGNVEIAIIMISKGADVNAVDSLNRTPLIYAAGGNDEEHTRIAEILLKRDDVKIDIKGGPEKCSALGYAVRSGNFDIAKALIEKGADVNALDEIYGYTPLMSAVSNNNFEMVKLLLDNKADFALFNLKLETALDIADDIENTDERITECLKNIHSEGLKKQGFSPNSFCPLTEEEMEVIDSIQKLG